MEPNFAYAWRHSYLAFFFTWFSVWNGIWNSKWIWNSININNCFVMQTSRSSKTNLRKPLTDFRPSWSKNNQHHWSRPMSKSKSFLAEITIAYQRISETFKIKCFFFCQKRVIHITSLKLLSMQEDCTPILYLSLYGCDWRMMIHAVLMFSKGEGIKEIIPDGQ